MEDEQWRSNPLTASRKERVAGKKKSEAIASELVLGAGLEPARISPHAPQACVSANFTTRAGLEIGA